MANQTQAAVAAIHGLYGIGATALHAAAELSRQLDQQYPDSRPRPRAMRYEYNRGAYLEISEVATGRVLRHYKSS